MGRPAFSLRLAHRPEVALVDLGLPTVDGYEVARQVRSALSASAPLMIALTGYGAPEQRAQALSAGFDLHIVKPVDPDRLATLLDEYAATRRRSRLTPRPAPRSSASADALDASRLALARGAGIIGAS